MAPNALVQTNVYAIGKESHVTRCLAGSNATFVYILRTGVVRNPAHCDIWRTTRSRETVGQILHVSRAKFGAPPYLAQLTISLDSDVLHALS